MQQQENYKLSLDGFATDNIWLMEDGPESHPIGIRLDSGDSGVVYVSRAQAKELADQLHDCAGAASTSVQPGEQKEISAESGSCVHGNSGDKAPCALCEAEALTRARQK